jgi:glycerol uptake facilitator protein
MTPFIAELVGTALLLFFGCSVVANVLLSKSKGEGAGWLVINFGWAIAVFIGVSATIKISGAHLNPAVTLAVAVLENDWSKVPTYIPAQFLGAMLGSAAAWLIYKQHFDATDNADLKLAVFCNTPAINNTLYNFITEAVSTFAFVLAIFLMGDNKGQFDIGVLGALPVALLVLGVGNSLGGPTGYAINPARDFGPRIMHFVLPIKGKGSSGWTYSWIPVVAPIVGGILAAIVKKYLL